VQELVARMPEAASVPALKVPLHWHWQLAEEPWLVPAKATP